jgi:hypothetical protein
MLSVVIVDAILAATLMAVAFTMAVVAITMVDGTMEAIGLRQLIHTTHVLLATNTIRTYTIRTCILRTVSFYHHQHHEWSNTVRFGT